MENVSDDKAFYVQDGKVIRSIHELLDSIHNISDYAFNYHVNEHKNDFANWIDHVLGNKKLAESLKELKSKGDFAKKLKTVKNGSSNTATPKKAESAKKTTTAKSKTVTAKKPAEAKPKKAAPKAKKK